ncbi:MAG: hypothetical protein GSR80_000604 [Desulfurococcales archaeon]|nr:hypothetical protein [Desulfurococcales archaeon]
MDWASVFQFYARLKRELREALWRAELSPECRRAAWEAVSRILEEKAAELEELAASA